MLLVYLGRMPWGLNGNEKTIHNDAEHNEVGRPGVVGKWAAVLVDKWADILVAVLDSKRVWRRTPDAVLGNKRVWVLGNILDVAPGNILDVALGNIVVQELPHNHMRVLARTIHSRCMLQRSRGQQKS